MDYPLLKMEVTTDPRARGFASMTDDEVTADLATANITRNRVVNSHELLGWAGQSQRYIKVLAATDNTALSDDVRNVAHVAAQTVGRDSTGFNPDSAEHVAMVDALVAAGVWAATDKTSLMELATESVSWVQVNGWFGLTAADVARAR